MFEYTYLLRKLLTSSSFVLPVDLQAILKQFSNTEKGPPLDRFIDLFIGCAGVVTADKVAMN